MAILVVLSNCRLRSIQLSEHISAGYTRSKESRHQGSGTNPISSLRLYQSRTKFSLLLATTFHSTGSHKRDVIPAAKPPGMPKNGYLEDHRRFHQLPQTCATFLVFATHNSHSRPSFNRLANRRPHRSISVSSEAQLKP